MAGVCVVLSVADSSHLQPGAQTHTHTVSVYCVCDACNGTPVVIFCRHTLLLICIISLSLAHNSSQISSGLKSH